MFFKISKILLLSPTPQITLYCYITTSVLVLVCMQKQDQEKTSVNRIGSSTNHVHMNPFQNKDTSVSLGVNTVYKKVHTALGVTSPVGGGGGGTQVLSWPWGYPSPVLAGGTPVLGYPPADTGILPWPGLGSPPQRKGPGTRDLGKNLGLGYSPDVERQIDACENNLPSYYVRGR